MSTLYCDLDGVLADFERKYHEVTGEWASETRARDGDLNWDAVHKDGTFYATTPTIPGALLFWDRIRKYRPSILTGIPSNVAGAEEQKKMWCHTFLGPHVPVICCKSEAKSCHCKPGDILVDDWERYKPEWEAVGGYWVTFKNPSQALAELEDLIRRTKWHVS
jgi:hypothetical protein